MRIEILKEVNVRVISLGLIFLLMIFMGSSFGQESPDSSTMLFDLVILRPLGVGLCALGISAAILSIPFTLASPNKEEVGKKLVEEPFKFTFSRPLGHIQPEGLKK